MEQDDIDDLSWASDAQKLAMTKGQANTVHKREEYNVRLYHYI